MDKDATFWVQFPFCFGSWLVIGWFLVQAASNLVWLVAWSANSKPCVSQVTGFWVMWLQLRCCFAAVLVPLNPQIHQNPALLAIPKPRDQLAAEAHMAGFSKTIIVQQLNTTLLVASVVI